MTPISLTQRQRNLLQALVTHYTTTERPATRKTLAAVLECPPATLARQMKPLKARHLVESFRGPTGGYTPTAQTYAVLARQEIER